MILLVLFFFRVATEALRILLARAQLDEVLKRLEEEKTWDAIKEQNTHISGVTLLARYPRCSVYLLEMDGVLKYIKTLLTRLHLESILKRCVRQLSCF